MNVKHQEHVHFILSTEGCDDAKLAKSVENYSMQSALKKKGLPVSLSKNKRENCKVESNSDVSSVVNPSIFIHSGDARAMRLLQTVFKTEKASVVAIQSFALSIIHPFDPSAAKSIKITDKKENPRNALERLKEILCDLDCSGYRQNGAVTINHQTDLNIGYYFC